MGVIDNITGNEDRKRNQSESVLIRYFYNFLVRNTKTWLKKKCDNLGINKRL